MNFNWKDRSDGSSECDVDLVGKLEAKLHVFETERDGTMEYSPTFCLVLGKYIWRVTKEHKPFATPQEAQNAAVAELNEFLRQMAGLYHKMGGAPTLRLNMRDLPRWEMQDPAAFARPTRDE